MESGFPTLTDSFLAGQDVLYAQFNDIEFYVEDESQEHFYFNVLKKIFSDIKFEKIFPLNGKTNVKNAALSNTGNKKKIYIVDLDFDEILGIKENIENLFYLEKYSIENHLFAKKAIFELIREKDSRLKDNEIEAKINYQELLSLSCHCETVKLFRTRNSRCSLFYFSIPNVFQTPAGFGNLSPNEV